MLVRNDRAPRGIDLGPAAVTSEGTVRGSFAIGSSGSAKPAEKQADPRREQGRFKVQPTSDQEIAHKREVWRRNQQSRRERLAASKGDSGDGI